MKKTTILFTLFAAFAMFTMVSAQTKTTDFSGVWELDAAKSKLGDRARVESINMTVAQTAKDLKVEKITKRALRNEVETRGGNAEIPNSGGMGRRVGGMFMGGDMTDNLTYSLEGKETKDEIPGIPGATSILKAKWEKDGKLVLNSSRTNDTPMGKMTMTVNETWSLSPDGKTLTVVREADSPRGKMSTEMVFVKKVQPATK